MLLENALVLDLSPAAVRRTAVRVQGGVITEVGELTPDPAEQRFDLAGQLLMPGLVSVHTVLARSLACGQPLPPSEPPPAELWRRYHRALDADAVHTAVRAGAESALRAGVTTVIEYLPAPRCPAAALVRAADALGDAGLRGVLAVALDDALDDVAFTELLEAYRTQERTQTLGLLVGLGAVEQVSDDRLAAAVALARELDTGLHAPIGRDPVVGLAEESIDRLRRLDALVEGSVFSHAVQLGPDSLDRLGREGIWVSHHPRADMNTGRGHAPVPWFPATSALGTAGVDQDLWAELQSGWLRAREAGVGWTPERFLALLTGGHHLASQHLGLLLGRIEPGAAADLIVVDIPPGPTLEADSVAYAMVYRLGAHCVRHVMVAGQWRMRDHRLLQPADPALPQRAAARLFARLAAEDTAATAS